MKFKYFFISFIFSYLQLVSGQSLYYDRPFHSYLNPISNTLSYYQYLPSYLSTDVNTYYKYPPVYYHPYIPNISFTEITENNTTMIPYAKQESSALSILNNVTSFVDIYSIMFVVMIIDIFLHG